MTELVNKLLGQCLQYTGMYVTMCLHHTGETGVGKSTLIDSLFKTSFDGESPTHTNMTRKPRSPATIAQLLLLAMFVVGEPVDEATSA